MNIFYLHDSPHISAKAMTNKHVVKMILESAQLMSTAHHELDGEQAPQDIYKTTHKNHPSAVWVRQSMQNYMWLWQHFVALSHEYTKRYNKVHATYRKLEGILSMPPKNIKNKDFTQPPQAMPDVYKEKDSIQAYRRYYMNKKIKSEDDLMRFVKTLAKEGI
jgi:hypothetical protein